MIGVALLTAIFSFQQALSDTLFVSNEKSASLAVIDTLETQHWTVVSQRAAGKLSNGLALTPDGNALYVSNGGEGTMSELRLDQNEISRTSQIGHRPWGLAFDASTRRVFVANGRSDSVSVIALDSGAARHIAVGKAPWGVLIQGQ